MKIRLGFVTNSSSSSFICEVCGDVEAGWDCGLEDVNMVECECGHTMCEDHIEDYDESKVDERIKDEAIIKLEACLNSKELASEHDKVEEFLNSIAKTPVEFVTESTVEEIINVFETTLGWNEVEYMSDYNSRWTPDTYIGRNEIRNGLIAEMCPLCQHEVITDTQLINHALTMLNMTHSELEEAARQFLIAKDNK